MATVTATTGMTTALPTATTARTATSARTTRATSVTATWATTTAGITATSGTTSGRGLGTTTTALCLLAGIVTRLRLLRPDGGNTLRDRNLERLGRLRGVIEVRQLQTRQSAAYGALDSANLVFFVGGTQRQRTSRSTRTRGSTHAVDVVLGNHRDIKDEDVAEFVDVDTASRDVGGNEHAEFAILETSQRRYTLCLRAVAVNALGSDACGIQLLG